MHYIKTRNELGEIFASRFTLGLAMAHSSDGQDWCLPSETKLLALWEPFLDTMLDVGQLDIEARDEWLDNPPRGLILDWLASWYRDEYG